MQRFKDVEKVQNDLFIYLFICYFIYNNIYKLSVSHFSWMCFSFNKLFLIFLVNPNFISLSKLISILYFLIFKQLFHFSNKASWLNDKLKSVFFPRYKLSSFCYFLIFMIVVLDWFFFHRCIKHSNFRITLKGFEFCCI